MINIVILATNIYMILGLRFIKQLNFYYTGSVPIQIHVFTDIDMLKYLSKNTTNVKIHHVKNNSWVDATNSKFTNIIKIRDEICENLDDYIYYFDADTVVNTYFDESFFVFSGSLAVGEHFNNRYDQMKPYERRSQSEAYVPINTPLKQVYYYGAFFGGKSNDVMSLCESLIEMQRKDKMKNIEPDWNDESYLNKYFHYNAPDRTVYQEEFDKFFGVSNKGGIENSRNAKKRLSIFELKLLSDNRENMFELENGKIIIK